MQKLANTFLGVFLVIGLFASTASASTINDVNYVMQPDTTILGDERDSISYAIGILMETSLKKQGFNDINMDVLLQAMRDGAAAKGQMQPMEANIVVSAYSDKLQKAKAAKLAAAGKAFLAANAQKEGVSVTASGLQYKVLKQGAGAKPIATSKVKVNYEGKLIDGTIFDSSYQRGEPISFGLDRVIRGWTEGLQLMNVGSTYEFYIPYDLGYGARGSGAAIPPYATLIFKVELLEIVEQ